MSAQDPTGFSGSKDSQAAIASGRSRGGSRAVAFRWLQLASVTGVDKTESGDWDGFLTVQLMTMEGTRERVKMTLAAVGNGLFVGGPPEIGSLVIIGWLPAGRPVVVGQAPITVQGLRDVKDLPDLVEGEYLIRSGNLDLLTNAQIPGATILLDRDGKILLKNRAKTVEVTVGATLDLDGLEEKDPKSGEAVHLKCRILDASGNQLAALSFGDEGSVTIQATEVHLDADSVAIGDDPTNGDRLVTQRWLRQVFDLHTHTGGAVGELTTAPIPIPVQGDVTEVLRSK
jgi:hypothetical protein